MQRKLVKQGAATLMISLPAKWVQKYKLDKGDEVNMIEEEDLLKISPLSVKEKASRASIDVSGLSPLVNRSLLALYEKGLDEIEVKFKDYSEVKDFHKRVLPELLGFEIVKQTSSSFILKDVTGCEKQEIDELIKRIFLILDSIAEELVQACEKKQKMDQVIEADTSVNRLSHFCLRVLNKKGYPVYSRTNQIYAIINSLEQIGDTYKAIAIEAEKEKSSKSQIETIRGSRELLANFREIIFSFDKEKLVKNARLYETLKKEIKGKSVSDALLMQLLNKIIIINNYLLVYSLGNE